MSAKTISRRDFLGSAGVATAGVGLAALAVAPAAHAAEPEPPRLPLKILTRGGLPPEHAQRLAAISPQIQLVAAGDDAQWQRELPEAAVIFGGFSQEDLRAARKLRWIQWSAAGVEHILFPELVNSPITLTNAKGCYAPEITEHVFGLLFGLTRGIGAQAQQMRNRRWEQKVKPIELRGMTMGIVGFGGIGRETARRAKAMDMRVAAVDAEPMYRERYSIADVISLVDDGLPELLQQADVVVSAAPHTRRSEGMFGEREFGLMKPTAYFINVSRGKLVQTPALVKALKAQQIAGAGLDVTDPEPLPPNHELWDMPNVLITPHIAGQSQYSGTRILDVFVENVRRYVSGYPLLNVVNKQAGY